MDAAEPSGHTSGVYESVFIPYLLLMMDLKSCFRFLDLILIVHRSFLSLWIKPTGSRPTFPFPWSALHPADGRKRLAWPQRRSRIQEGGLQIVRLQRARLCRCALVQVQEFMWWPGTFRCGCRAADVTECSAIFIFCRGLQKLVLRNITYGMGEMYRGIFTAAQVKILQKYIPEISPSDVLR